MAVERHQAVLLVQRAAVMRAIRRAREYRADNDVQILQSVIALLEDLYDMAPLAFKRDNPTKH